MSSICCRLCRDIHCESSYTAYGYPQWITGHTELAVVADGDVGHRNHSLHGQQAPEGHVFLEFTQRMGYHSQSIKFQPEIAKSRCLPEDAVRIAHLATVLKLGTVYLLYHRSTKHA